MGEDSISYAEGLYYGLTLKHAFIKSFMWLLSVYLKLMEGLFNPGFIMKT